MEKIKLSDAWVDKHEIVYQKRLKTIEKKIDKKREEIKKLEDREYQIEQSGRKRYQAYVKSLEKK